MNTQRSLRTLFALLLLSAVVAASACNRGDERAVKGRAGPNGSAHDTVSDVALNEDGLGPVQVGMTLAEAVNMGLLNENPNMKKDCDFVFPAVGAGIPDNVGVMIVKGKVARIDVDTGSVTTEDGAKIGDTEDKIKSIYDGDLQIEPHKYIPGGHYMIVMGDSTSAGKAIVFETNGKVVTNFRAGRLPEVKWVEGCS
ncbi:MAG TPA: hypothetical protein VHT23_00035 [Gemmatimonadaceae bacterium]|jgi:hypothetical protein|nr:hypothetical protein [Gemmatimonadaceae bacterium]